MRKIKKLFNKYLKKIDSNREVVFNYDNFFIHLPSDHLLPAYQKEHKKYDRFLPHLVSFIEDKKTVIDVGANVGDTLAGMFNTNPNLDYVCIEPDTIFFDYLEKNIKRIQDSFQFAKIRGVQSLVGKAINNVLLEGSGGTKHAVYQTSGTTSDKNLIQSKQLDQIVDELGCTNIRLLKTDIDGFDWDAIESARELLINQRPMVFFECQYDEEYQINCYQNAIIWLNSIGYCNWTIFDNFGEILLTTDNVQNIFQLMNYIWRQNCGLSTRTIYYCDILAATENDVALVRKAISEY
jgi:FkbM family methyltransferase